MAGDPDPDSCSSPMRSVLIQILVFCRAMQSNPDDDDDPVPAETFSIKLTDLKVRGKASLTRPSEIFLSFR